jgi:cysteine synthase
MAVHDHIADALKAPHLVRLSDNIVLARFETIKIYSALAAVRTLLERGVVKPGQTLVDSSSGIYATSLALACHRYGMRCHIVASTTVDAAVRAQLEILGATIEQMPPSSSLNLDQNARVRRIHQLLAERPDIHWMRQYHDEIHYLGYQELARLIAADIGVRALTIVGGVGSGASTGGTAGYLRQRNPDVQLVGLQPFGSVTFGSEHFSDPEAIIAGIGSSIPFDNVHHELYDAIHWIDFRHAMAGAIALLREHAVFAGLSTGAGYLVARWLAARSRNRTHLIIGADTGHRYVERVFARHRQAPDPTDLRPKEIDSLDDLEMPWSAIAWQRKPYPPTPKRAHQPPAKTR